MAALATSLTEFSDRENARTWITDSHTISDPQVVIQKRRVPAGSANTSIAENSVKVVFGTRDSEGAPMDQKVSFEGIVRYPQGSESADITAALAIFRDLIASDEFTASVTSQGYLK